MRRPSHITWDHMFERLGSTIRCRRARCSSRTPYSPLIRRSLTLYDRLCRESRYFLNPSVPLRPLRMTRRGSSVADLRRPMRLNVCHREPTAVGIMKIERPSQLGVSPFTVSCALPQALGKYGLQKKLGAILLYPLKQLRRYHTDLCHVILPAQRRSWESAAVRIKQRSEQQIDW